MKTSGGDELSRITYLLWSFIPFHAMRVAVQSGLLELLSTNERADYDKITSHMGWQLRPTQLLIDVLETVGIVETTEQGVRATVFAHRWLVKEGPLYVGHYFDRLLLLDAAYHNLEERLATDSPYPPLEAATLKTFGLSPGSTENDARDFADVLNATSTPVAEAFLNIADIPGDAAVLDVGAGTGVFTKLLLCRGHKGLVEFLDHHVREAAVG